MVTFTLLNRNENMQLFQMIRRHWKTWAFVLYVVLGVFSISQHEIWRDEWQAWLIARDSASLGDLFRNLQYEGHPYLWHILLWLLNKISHNGVMMQMLHVLIACCAAALVLWKSPFGNGQKAGLIFGYFFIFEYLVPARSYGLSMLLTFLFAHWYSQGPKYYFHCVAALFLLAHTQFYGWVIAASLGVWMFWPWRKVLPFRTFLSGQLIGLAGLALALWQMIPPEDTGHLTGNRLGINPGEMVRSVATLWKGFVPMPSPNYGVWNTNIADLWPFASYFQAFLAGVTGFFVSLLLWRKKPALYFFWSVAAVFMAFSYIKFYGFTRHHGMFYIAFIGALWMVMAPHNTAPSSVPAQFSNQAGRIRNFFLALISGLQIIGGAIMLYQDWRLPFSPAKETCAFLRSKNMEDWDIYVEKDYIGAPLAGYLNRQVYYIRIKKEGSFLVWNKARQAGIPVEKAAAIAVSDAKKMKKKILLALSQPLDHPELLNVKAIARFDSAIEKGERYYLYEASF